MIVTCMLDMCLFGHVCSRKFESITRLIMYHVLLLCDSICSYPLGSTNNILNVTVDIGAREVTCQFLNGPVASATCTIQYGTDPTYVNLPNTDSFNGTNVNSLTVPLSTPLQADTFYYYVVSSMRVRMQGTFRSGMSHSLFCRNFDRSTYLVCTLLRQCYKLHNTSVGTRVLCCGFSNDNYQQSITLQVYSCVSLQL